MRRSLTLALTLTFSVFGCDYPETPFEIIELGWPISLRCTLTNFIGAEEVVTTPTYAADGTVDWVPGCNQGKSTGSWRCPAPPQAWWTTDGVQGIVRCNLAPCKGIDPGKVIWVTYPDGPEVKAQQTPTTLPTAAPGGTAPQGGGDSCLNEENGWVFAPQQ